MKSEFNAFYQKGYVSPYLEELYLDTEGVLCSSAENESLIEDNEWIELLG